MKTMEINFGERLREYRLKRKLSQQALADLVGCERPRISEWESGRNSPTLTTIQRLASALKIPVWRLVR